MILREVPMKKIMIINQLQFGYEVDTYYYCKYLRNNFDVTYICWDYGKEKIEMQGIKTIYISRKGNIAIRNMRFIKDVSNAIRNDDYHVHIIEYFRGCSILKFLSPSKNFIFDIRTGSVSQRKINRFLFDSLMGIESNFFKYCTIISEPLRAKLGIATEKTYILPLGADVISKKPKKYDSLRLLYIGTLHNRNIEQTIIGFEKFYSRLKHTIEMSYTIIGEGYNNEVEELRQLVKEKLLLGIVKIEGYIQHDAAKKYFDTHNIGVSFIPKTDFFDVQPPTKTFEYLLSGMPVIATSTLENKKVINIDNGVLINDTSEGFYQGLLKLYNRLDDYDSEQIRVNAKQYEWKKVVEGFKNFIETI